LQRKPSARRLLDPSDDGSLNSTLHAGFMSWRDYAYCYRRAADTLSERFPIPLDSPEAMFLPIVFLYRHAVEAALKGILVELRVGADDATPFPTDHHIRELWREIRPQISRSSGLLAEEWLERAETLVNELDAVDPGSMHFRYPVSRKGGALLRAGFTLDVSNLAAAMDDLFYVLD
jgi:hypothetical protein